MALRDVTARGVQRAMAEFNEIGRDEFLARYGFGKARDYFLIHGGIRYDSKAIVGVAHGYDRPDLGALKRSDFSGGDATVARHLESLGLDVEKPTRTPAWAEEELVLALDLYLRYGQLKYKDPPVIELSQVLRSLRIHTARRDPDRFRNPNSVQLKLANFAALDPSYDGRGMMRTSKRDVEVWNRYATDEDALAAAVDAIKGGHGLMTAQLPKASRDHVIDIEVEQQHVEQFQVTVPNQTIEATRREQKLVLSYAAHLENEGHRVTRRRYQLKGYSPPLLCDLVDVTDNVLYEAKGDVRRTSVRMAIGQLLDYRRFEPPAMKLGVLLPRKPSQDIIQLIGSVPASVVWRTKGGFASKKA